jgi:ABC-type lipoprotein release transport system permease subunit
VSPGLAASAGDDGIVTVETGVAVVDLRVAAVVSSFPTITDPDAQVAIADLAPVRLALAAALPTAAHPNEVWLRVDEPAALPRVRAALAEPPFRVVEAAWRDEIAAARSADPIARAAASGLFAAAAVAVLLALAGIVVGLAGDVADRRGEFGELERQGVRPAVLGRVLVARTVGVAAAGSVAGLAAGAILAAFAPALTSLAADARAAVPPLVPVVPVAPLAAVLAGALIVGALATVMVARTAFGGATLGERRASCRPAPAGPIVGTEADRA